MEILISVKNVPDDSREIRLDPETMQPDLSRAESQASAFETYGLEMAARYNEENGGGSITLLSIGDEASRITLRNCLAVGANAACLVPDESAGSKDPYLIANIIRNAIPEIEKLRGSSFDMFMLGRESTDHIDGETGPILAELMGLPFVSDVVEFSAEGNVLTVKKELDSEYHIIETSLPCVITVAKPNYDPRYPTIKSKMAARKIEIPDIPVTAGDAESRITYLNFTDPPRRSAGAKFTDLSPEDAAAKIISAIAEDKVI